jgi:hypothetical protein
MVVVVVVPRTVVVVEPTTVVVVVEVMRVVVVVEAIDVIVVVVAIVVVVVAIDVVVVVASVDVVMADVVVVVVAAGHDPVRGWQVRKRRSLSFFGLPVAVALPSRRSVFCLNVLPPFPWRFLRLMTTSE